jgi:Ca2+-transporting ATPase
MAVYRWAIRRHGQGLTAQTVAFTAASLAEILYALACGSPLVWTPHSTRPGEYNRPSPNGILMGAVGATALLQVLAPLLPPLRRLLQLAPLDRRDWLTVLSGAVLPVVVAATRRQPPQDQGSGIKGPGSGVRIGPLPIRAD